MNSKTHVAILLDCSGSMQACQTETVAGFNEQVQAIRKSAQLSGAEGATFVTLAVFNDGVEFVRFAEPVDRLMEISADEYHPDSLTAMLDAVGQTLKRFEKKVKDSESIHYLVIIISDGEENDSREFTYERIAEMIQKRQQTGRWTFSYMGANQDLSDISKRLSIPKSNVAIYTSSGKGTLIGMGALSKSTMDFLDRRSKGAATSDKFFRDEDEVQSVDDDDSGKKGGGPLLH
jgi:uncharacterized protein YegL